MLAFAAAAANMEDDSEALESVLAFIEAYNVDALSTDEGSAIDAEAAPPPAKAKAKAKAKAPRRKRAKRDSDSTEDEKPSASTTSYTTMLQRRKRAEVQTLREEVQELEMHLTRLQRARWGDDSTENPPTSAQKSSPSKRKRSSSEPPSTIRLSEMWDELAKNAARENGVPIDAKSGSADSLVKQKGDNEWLDAAVAEYRLRRRSELKNRQLKALMRQQSNLNTSVLRLLQKRAPFPVRAVLGVQPVKNADLTHSFACVQGVEALLVSSTSNTFPSEIVEYRIQEAAVESEIMQLYREVELVLGPPPGDGIESIVCSLEGKHSPSIGRHIEVRTTTPMTRSASKAAMRVWRKLCSNPDQHLNFFSEVSEYFLARFVVRYGCVFLCSLLHVDLRTRFIRQEVLLAGDLS